MVQFPYSASFSSEEYAIIRRGLEPQSSDDKWLVTCENDWISFARSWTGFEIYRIRLEARGGRHHVTQALVCDDATRYRRESDRFDRRSLDWLIRGLILGQEVEMPIPAALKRAIALESGMLWLGFPVRVPTAVRHAVAAARRLPRRAMYRIRALFRRLGPGALTDDQLRAVAERHVAAVAGPRWFAQIHWAAEPDGAWVIAAHPDGPTHDFDTELPQPFFVDRFDGLIVSPRPNDVRRAYTALDAWRAAGVPGAAALFDTDGQSDDLEADAALTDRWIRVWLDGAHERFVGISEDA